MKSFQSTAAIATALALLAVAPAHARQTTAPKAVDQGSDDLRRKILAEPGMAKVMHDLFAGTAMRIARLERLVAIGQLCRVLGQKDADEILANGRTELDDARSMLSSSRHISCATDHR